MGTPTEEIKLYSGKAERFREIKNQLEKQLGYEPSNSEVFSHMVMEWSEQRADRRH